MTDDPRPELSIGNADGTVSVTITISGERSTIHLSPADASLAGTQLLAAALRQLPDEQRFQGVEVDHSSGDEETADRVVPKPAPPKVRERGAEVAATPRGVAAAGSAGGPGSSGGSERPSGSAVGDEGDAAAEGGRGAVQDDGSSISVPPGYEALLEDDSEQDWQLTYSARNRARDIGVFDEEMIAAATSPEIIELDETQDPPARSYIRDGISVLVPVGDPTKIIGVMRVPRATLSQSVPKTPSGGPGKKMPGGRAELRQMLEQHGFVIDFQGASHPKVSHPARPGTTVTIPASPSDYRSYRNVIAQVRRIFGVDITQHP